MNAIRINDEVTHVKGFMYDDCHKIYLITSDKDLKHITGEDRCKWCRRSHPARIGCWFAWLMGWQ